MLFRFVDEHVFIDEARLLEGGARATGKAAMDLIRIEGLELRCIVGLRTYERHRPQPISLDIALGLKISPPPVAAGASPIAPITLG
ncbi:MAG: hypothetical protein QM793_14685 [Muricomes sp.]